MDERKDRFECWFNKALNITSAASLFVGSYYFAVAGKTTEMGLVISAGFIGMAFANIDKLTEFSGFGIVAKIREAKNTIKEGEETIQKLKTLAIALSKPVIDMSAAFGYVGKYRDLDKFKMRSPVVTALKELKLNDEQIFECTRNLDKLILHSLGYVVLAEISKTDPTLGVSNYIDQNNEKNPTPELLDQLLKDRSITSPDILEALQSYREFYYNKKFEFPPQWK